MDRELTQAEQSDLTCLRVAYELFESEPVVSVLTSITSKMFTIYRNVFLLDFSQENTAYMCKTISYPVAWNQVTFDQLRKMAKLYVMDRQ